MIHRKAIQAKKKSSQTAASIKEKRGESSADIKAAPIRKRSASVKERRMDMEKKAGEFGAYAKEEFSTAIKEIEAGIKSMMDSTEDMRGEMSRYASNFNAAVSDKIAAVNIFHSEIADKMAEINAYITEFYGE